MNNFGRSLIMWLAIALMVAAFFNLFQQDSAGGKSAKEVIAYTDFLADVDADKISDITIDRETITGHKKDNSEFKTHIPPNTDVVARVEKSGVRITSKPMEQEGGFLSTFMWSWMPLLLWIGVWIYFMRQMNGKGGGGAMSFGRSKARMLNERKDQKKFSDVAGVEEAKEELQEIVEFLRDPQKFQRLGGKIPKGVLLVGPPGTGKTLIARAVAGEAGVPFFIISGSDFVEMFVGVGASRVRDLFEQGKKNAPCIIFIDEIDAVGRHRGAGYGGGNDEREQTLNQLLVEMDGFEANEGVILIAATNRPDVLDPALLRPGRFDRQVTVPNPDVKGREAILKVHVKNIPLAQNVDLATIAKGTPGFSGAELANLVNEAALLAARNGKRVVGNQDLEDAKDKVMMGAERRSLAMSEEEKKNTAYHEGGHALVSLHLPASDPIHKATIVPRGQALGMVMRLPEGDRYSMQKDKMKAHLAVAMGGRVAEELIMGEDKYTNGASGDIKSATDMARRMVTEWGMSETIGMLDYSERQDHMGMPRQISAETQSLIEREVRALVDEGYQFAKKVLTENMDDLHTIAQALLEYETLSGDDIQTLLRGETLDRDDEAEKTVQDTAKPQSSVPTAGGLSVQSEDKTTSDDEKKDT